MKKATKAGIGIVSVFVILFVILSATGVLGRAFGRAGEWEQREGNPLPCYEAAAEWDKWGIAFGNDRSYTNLGILYLNGWGVEQDYEKAASLFSEGTERGDMKAPRYLGLMYRDGQITGSPDISNAVKYFEIGIDRGDISSMFYLGKFYEAGTGVEKDERKAFELYSRSAAHGGTPASPAMHALGRCYEDGIGVEADTEQAAYWYALAEENGYTPEKE